MNDAEPSPNVKDQVRELARLFEEVYIALHGSRKNDKRKFIDAKCASGRFLYLAYSRTPGNCILESLDQIEASINAGDASGYSLALRALKECFRVDWDLEAKLVLLHMCLTPQGAKAVLDGKSKGVLQSEVSSSKVSWSEVKDVVRSLSQAKSVTTEYQKSLAYLRDALLPTK